MPQLILLLEKTPKMIRRKQRFNSLCQRLRCAFLSSRLCKKSLDSENLDYIESGGTKPNPRSGLAYEGKLDNYDVRANIM